MMNEFFAQRILLGKCTFAEVPEKLKEGVAEYLKQIGAANLIGDDNYVTTEEIKEYGGI